MICCDCLKNIPEVFTFNRIIRKRNGEFHHCMSCLKKYHLISKNHCPNCFRSQSSIEICEDCKKWQQKGGKCRNVAFFKYDEAFSDWLERFKYQGALHLKYSFTDLLFENLKSEKAGIVPIPMAKEKLKTRGFNQTEELLLGAGIPFIPILGKYSSDELPQSQKKKKERMALKQVFFIDQESKNKELILFDDVYTTGTTLKKAQECLEAQGYEVKYSLTLAR